MTAPLDLARMRELWEDSPELSARIIGERFGVTKNVVIGRADRGEWKPRRRAMDEPHPSWPAERVAELLKLDAAHLGYAEIGRRLGCSRRAAHSKLSRLRARGDLSQPRTIFDRLAAAHARMDAVLAATQAVMDAGGRRPETQDVAL